MTVKPTMNMIVEELKKALWNCKIKPVLSIYLKSTTRDFVLSASVCPTLHFTKSFWKCPTVFTVIRQACANLLWEAFLFYSATSWNSKERSWLKLVCWITLLQKIGKGAYFSEALVKAVISSQNFVFSAFHFKQVGCPYIAISSDLVLCPLIF